MKDITKQNFKFALVMFQSQDNTEQQSSQAQARSSSYIVPHSFS